MKASLTMYKTGRASKIQQILDFLSRASISEEKLKSLKTLPIGVDVFFFYVTDTGQIRRVFIPVKPGLIFVCKAMSVPYSCSIH